jgi:hypothetical protein
LFGLSKPNLLETPIRYHHVTQFIALKVNPVNPVHTQPSGRRYDQQATLLLTLDAPVDFMAFSLQLLQMDKARLSFAPSYVDAKTKSKLKTRK